MKKKKKIKEEIQKKNQILSWKIEKEKKMISIIKITIIIVKD